MRSFYLGWPIRQTVSAESSTAQALVQTAERFPLSWSHYVRLMQVENEHARVFYEKETLRGGWTVRQLNRQIGSQFYERTALSKNEIASANPHTHGRTNDGRPPTRLLMPRRYTRISRPPVREVRRMRITSDASSSTDTSRNIHGCSDTP